MSDLAHMLCERKKVSGFATGSGEGLLFGEKNTHMLTEVLFKSVAEHFLNQVQRPKGIVSPAEEAVTGGLEQIFGEKVDECHFDSITRAKLAQERVDGRWQVVFRQREPGECDVLLGDSFEFFVGLVEGE